MELGLTFPLQRFLKQKTDDGSQPDRRYCWDAHVIDLRGCKSLLARPLSQPVHLCVLRRVPARVARFVRAL